MIPENQDFRMFVCAAFTPRESSNSCNADLSLNVQMKVPTQQLKDLS
jgi:hypothetical protein